jgi:uncharacterized membrane protein
MRDENNPARGAGPAPQRPGPSLARPEWVFLILAAAVGLFLALVNPPFQSPDEDAHFTRIFQLSEGTLIAQKSQDQIGGWLPQSIYDAWEPFPYIDKVDLDIVRKLLQEPFTAEPRHFFPFMHTALYSPVAYGPAILGVWTGRAFGLSALGQLYAARVATLLGCLAIVFFAIRIMPVFKWVMVMIALMPMTVFLFATPSADAMTNALALLTTALILRSALAKSGPVGTGEWMTIGAVSLLLALTKQLYFPLVIMTFLIPVERFGGWKRKVMLCLGVIGAALVANLIWAMLVRHTVTVESWAQPEEQTLFVLSHPLRYAGVLHQMLLDRWETYLIWFVGTLGWLNVSLPAWIWPTYLTILAATALADRGKGRPLAWWEKSLIIGICSVTILFIATSQYISYTAPTSKMIRGVQGRYFIPLAVAGLLVLYNRKLKVPEKAISLVVIIYCLTVLIVTCQTLVTQFYH